MHIRTFSNTCICISHKLLEGYLAFVADMLQWTPGHLQLVRQTFANITITDMYEEFPIIIKHKGLPCQVNIVYEEFLKKEVLQDCTFKYSLHQTLKMSTYYQNIDFLCVSYASDQISNKTEYTGKQNPTVPFSKQHFCYLFDTQHIPPTKKNSNHITQFVSHNLNFN